MGRQPYLKGATRDERVKHAVGRGARPRQAAGERRRTTAIHGVALGDGVVVAGAIIDEATGERQEEHGGGR